MLLNQEPMKLIRNTVPICLLHGTYDLLNWAKVKLRTLMDLLGDRRRPQVCSQLFKVAPVLVESIKFHLDLISISTHEQD